MNHHSSRSGTMALTLLLWLAACGGGGGDGGGGDQPLTPASQLVMEIEDNDSPSRATGLPAGSIATGDITSVGDVDMWRFDANAGDVFRLTLHATRLAFKVWDQKATVPRLRIIEPDGVSLLQSHDVALGWDHGLHDLDFPFILIKETGPHFISVDCQDPLAGGGPYLFELEQITLLNPQLENEAPGSVGANDDPSSAQTIEPGTIVGRLVDGDEDWYVFRGPTVFPISLLRYRFEVTAYRNGVPGNAPRYPDLRLELHDASGLQVRDGDSFFYDPALGYSTLTPGPVVFLRVLGSVDDTVPSPYVIEFDLMSDPSPLPLEIEPNDELATSTLMRYGEVVLGFGTSPPDVGDDFFRFDGQAGDMIRLWLWHQGNTNFSNFSIGFQGSLSILMPDGTTELPFDRTGQTFDVCRAILPQTGTYTIRVREADLAAATGPPYVLDLELVARAQFETEDNDTRATADNVGATGRVAGVIDDQGDPDVYLFDALEDELVKILVFAKPAERPGSGAFEVLDGFGSDLAPQLIVQDSDNTPLAFSDFAIRLQHNVSAESIVDGLATVGLSFVAPHAGQFSVLVRARDAKAGPEQIYQLHVVRAAQGR